MESMSILRCGVTVGAIRIGCWGEDHHVGCLFVVFKCVL